MHSRPEPSDQLAWPSFRSCCGQFFREARPLPLAAAAAWVGLARCHHARDNDDV